MKRSIGDHVKGALGGLDPLLAPALKLAELPVLPDRHRAEELAAQVLGIVEGVTALSEKETNVESSAQLDHVAQALGACLISLTAYARGRVPKLTQKPDLTIVS